MRVCAVLVTLVGLAWALPARAWTVAEVTGVSADITLDSTHEAAVVRLQGDVAVRGGWLTRLELQLVSDEGALVRDPRLFVLTEDDNQEKEPRIVRAVPLEHRFRKDGSLLLEFDRKDAPQKGRYRFEVLYRVRHIVRGAGGSSELRWSLPPWQSGLDDIVIRVHLRDDLGVQPSEVHPIEEMEAPITSRDRDGYLTLTWSRPHLPRTLGWDIGARLSGLSAPVAKEVLPEEEDPVTPLLTEAAVVAHASNPQFWWAVCGVCLSLVLLGFFGELRLRAAPSYKAPKAGLLRSVEIAGLRTSAVYYLRIGSRCGDRVVPYVHLTFEAHSAAAVALRRTFAAVGPEDTTLTLPYREGLEEELAAMFARFSAAHRKVAPTHEPLSLAA